MLTPHVPTSVREREGLLSVTSDAAQTSAAATTVFSTTRAPSAVLTPEVDLVSVMSLATACSSLFRPERVEMSLVLELQRAARLHS